MSDKKSFFEYVKEYWAAFVALLIVFLGVFAWFFKSKADSSEALNNNIETKEKVLTKQQDIAKIEGEIKSEEEKRKFLEEQKKKEQNKDESLEDINKFFNDRNNR